MNYQPSNDQSFSPQQEFQTFLLWERSTRDTLDVKRVYIDMAGDLAAGVMLSEIVYWHLPSAKGNSRLRAEHEGYLWIATRRYEWWERCRLSPDQADYALRKLVKRGLVEKRLFKFNGQPTVHIRLQVDNFLDAFQKALEGPASNPFAPQNDEEMVEVSEMEFVNFRNGIREIPNLDSKSGQIPLTETTNRDSPPPPPAGDASKVSAPALACPATPLEAEHHPDLALFRRITDGLFPGRSDWRTIIDRLQFLRRKHPELDGEQLAQAGKPYWSVWVERGYSPTHPDWLEWWMNSRIPPRRPKGKKSAGKPHETEAELEALRKRGEELLLPLIAAPNRDMEQET